MHPSNLTVIVADSVMDRSLQVKFFQSLGAFRPRRSMALALAAVLVLSACGGVRPPPPDPLEALGPGAQIAYVVADAESGAVTAARLPDRPMIPASTAKVPTMVAALELLGPDFRFHTRILATGAPDKDGILSGDLILAGGGDPLLTPQDLFGLAVRLRDLGLKRVGGRFLYDDSLLPALPAINPDQPAEARYNPGIGALSVDFNRWRLVWRPGAEPGTRELTRLPPLDANKAVPGGLPTGAGRPVVWQQSEWRLGADAPADGDRFLPGKSPGLAAAQLFRRLAGQAGLDLPAPQPGRAASESRLVADIAGLPLAEIARLGLEHSNNLVSELTGLTAARLLAGRPDTLAASSAALGRWLRAAIDRTMPGTDWTGWRLPNHSGLSRLARVTPAQMAAVLRYAYHQRYGGWPFVSYLPTAGFRKAFRDRFLTEDASGRIWAKTGTMHYAKGLVGYLMTEDGRTKVFALYIADAEKRAGYDSLDPTTRDTPEQQERALAWIDAAEQAEQAIVLEWLRP
jgi:D-alanyl-D-alanine carboxypeptidase/D-alanyl-D-alanine-endopeptidase (penicillin-binding protein 4)